MERGDHESVAQLFLGDEEFVPGGTVTLPVDPAHHLRVRRVAAGARIALVDGAGHRAIGTLVRLTPTMAVEVERVTVSAPPPAIHLLAPIADKERMLLLAEKATELGVTSWRPVLYRRSRSVKPRGEGATFASKVRARMITALEQSGGEWLPSLYPEATLSRALPALPPDGVRIALNQTGEGPETFHQGAGAPVTVAIGPEGGFEEDELELLTSHGFATVRLGDNILRFETAAIAGIVLARAALATQRV